MLSINLTTTSNRIFLCKITLYSLLNQSRKPDEINLWLSKDKYLSDNGIEEIPSFIKELNSIDNIINVHFVENTGPYRKLVPAILSANDDDILVYCDDDVVYGENWLDSLYSHYLNNDKKFIVASRIRLTKKNIFGGRMSYLSSIIYTGNKPLSDNYIITGIGGAILSKNNISIDLFKNNDFIKVAPKTDDLWLSKVFQISNAKVLPCVTALNQISEIVHTIDSLNITNNNNLSGSKLNIIFKRIIRKFKSYFGLLKTNNDLSFKKVNDYFDRKSL